MTLPSLPFLLTAVVYVLLGIWIFLKHDNKVQQLFATLCIATCFWQGIWALLFWKSPPSLIEVWLKIGYTGIVFIPAIFYHFIVELTGRERFAALRWYAYAISGILVVLNWAGTLFVDGFYRYSWGTAAKAGWMYPLFVVFFSTVIVRMVVLLQGYRLDLGTTLIKKHQAGWVLFATVIYSAGSIDVLSNYGLSVFPLSFLFTGVAVGFFSYAMFRHELLSISVSPESIDELQRRGQASEEMQRMGMTTAFPLVSQGELLGYLLIGEKMSEEAYSKEDLLLLRIVANQAALAYQRVRYLEMAVRGARTEMLGEIAGGFAHEIKTPLANISLPAELSFIDLLDVEKGRRPWEEIVPDLKQRMKDIMQQALRASEKIEAIRQFSKPGEIHLEPVLLSQIFKNSLNVLDHLMRTSNVNLKTEFPPQLPAIRASGKQLEIVFVNLLKNGIEAMVQGNPEGLARNLWLKAQEEGDWVVISVKDSGPGIKHTAMGHLFEAYFTTKGAKGTGVGLFLSHQVIKAHGGSIEVRSEEGKGTEFVIRLPKFAQALRSKIHEAA